VPTGETLRIGTSGTNRRQTGRPRVGVAMHTFRTALGHRRARLPRVGPIPRPTGGGYPN